MLLDIHILQFTLLMPISFTSFISLHMAKTLAPAPITEAPIDLAQKCDRAACQLPYCFCSKDGTIIPGGLEAENVSRHLLKWQPVERDYS